MAVLWLFAANESTAAINPADPGLADASAYGLKEIPNNQLSALCVECHTENPAPGYGSHFVLNKLRGELRFTRSGGGWEDGYWGIREEGQFFKIDPWAVSDGGNGGISKYGYYDERRSVVFSGSGSALIAAESSMLESRAPIFGFFEIICESCHNVRVNVAGGYHLLARVVDNAEVVDERVNGPIADLCVGCHGFLYHDDGGVANSLNANWPDPRNFSEVAGTRRGNNERHFITGELYPRNHHVMTGDVIDFPLAETGLLVRDVKVLSDTMVSSPIRTNYDKGTMPIRPVAIEPIVYPADPKHLHCVTCHAPAHGGEPSMGAAILRGVNLFGRDTGGGIDRISDGKEWGRYRDANFCLLCHE